MGKRELLLIVAFVIVGAVVYQATAPPAGPNERSLSLSRILDHVRREMRGNRANAEETKVLTYELDRAQTEVRVSGAFVELTITGEDRADIELRVRVTSTGYDEEEAKNLVRQTMEMMKIDRAGPVWRLTQEYPRPGTQRSFLTLHVPARVSVRVDQGAPRTAIANVAATELTVRGETTLKKIAGRATVTHRGGRLVIEDVGTLKLSGRGSEATVSRVRGDASFSMQGGELTAASISGPIDLEAQNADVTLEKLDEAQGPLRVSAVAGSVTLEGLTGDARIDGRNTEIDIAMSKAASVAVYNEGDEPMEITAPPGGFVLDALVTDGRLTLPDDIRDHLKASSGSDDAKDQRANGAVRGGGPTITLRANRGDIRILTPKTPNAER